MSAHPIVDAEWWTVEHAITKRPLANRRGWPCLFSAREYAAAAAQKAKLPMARVAHHGGNADVIAFLEAAARAGATGVVIDPGQKGARWFSLRPECWDWDAVRRARNNRQMGAGA